MLSTRLSLLTDARAGSQEAWSTVVYLYRPLIYGWLRHHDVSHHDAEELTQEVLTVLVTELPGFTHSGNHGAFRCWVRQITANRARGFWRAGRYRPAADEQRLLAMAEELVDDSSDMSRRWDREHDQHVLQQLWLRVEAEFEPATLTAFRRLVFQGIPADRVATELGMSVGAVYSAKSRVLRQLRKQAAGFFDPSVFL